VAVSATARSLIPKGLMFLNRIFVVSTCKEFSIAVATQYSPLPFMHASFQTPECGKQRFFAGFRRTAGRRVGQGAVRLADRLG